SRAFLLQAGRLWRSHEVFKEWNDWYRWFLGSWHPIELAPLREDSDVKRLFIEVRDAIPEVSAAEFYSLLGGLHSWFGRIILTWRLDGQAPYRDIREPIPHEYIVMAAKKTGVELAGIRRIADSLSEFWGWDITEGLPQG